MNINEEMVNYQLERLAKSFNTTVNELIPKIQQYKMATSLFGMVVSLIIIVLIFVAFVFFVKSASEWDKSGMILAGIMFELMPTIPLIVNSYNYVCWKYAPEIRCIEYVLELIKK